MIETASLFQRCQPATTSGTSRKTPGYLNQCGSPPPPWTSFQARGTIDCSSGFRRLPNGRPYSIPTNRSAAASPTIAASAVPTPPQRVSAHRSRRRRNLDLGRRVADELGDVSRSDDDRIDSRPLELDHLLATRRGKRRDRKLAGRDARQQIKRAVPVVVLSFGREQEDLRIWPVQHLFELFLISDLDDKVEPELDGLPMAGCELVARAHDARVRTGTSAGAG